MIYRKKGAISPSLPNYVLANKLYQAILETSKPIEDWRRHSAFVSVSSISAACRRSQPVTHGVGKQ